MEPQPWSRRTFLAAATLGGLAAAVGCGSDPSAGQPGSGDRPSWSSMNRLAIPPLDTGTVVGGRRRFELVMAAGTSELQPGRPTATWGFNGAYLGPTLRAAAGEEVEIIVRNRLPESSSVHWHGMRLPARMDGGPHQPIASGTTWTPTWTIDQPAATLWYHPHLHGATALQVYRGLAGLFIVDDGDTNGDLPHEYGVDDIPLVIQDRVIADDGTLIEDDPVATWGLMGNRILVNGTLDPAVELTARSTRLRILNGSNARMYNLRFSDERPFAVIANDVSHLQRPATVTEASLTPGERIEIILDLAERDDIALTSRSGDNGVDEGDFDIVRIRAAARLDGNQRTPGPNTGHPTAIVPSAGATVRRFRLSGHDEINGREHDMARIDEVVPRGAIEIWEIENRVYAHNFHIHDAAFTVLDTDGAPPPDHERGLKDTVFVPGKTTVRLAVQFGNAVDPTAPYMYHCHMLRHEDAGMMGQFTVVDPDDVEDAPRTLELDGEHHPT